MAAGELSFAKDELATTRKALRAEKRARRREATRAEKAEKRVKALERQLKHSKAENQRLKEKLEQAQREKKRQAAPFSKGDPKANPKKPGRKKGSQYGQRGERQRPNKIDEVLEAPLPDECPHCGGLVTETAVHEQTVTCSCRALTACQEANYSGRFAPGTSWPEEVNSEFREEQQAAAWGIHDEAEGRGTRLGEGDRRVGRRQGTRDPYEDGRDQGSWGEHMFREGLPPRPRAGPRLGSCYQETRPAPEASRGAGALDRSGTRLAGGTSGRACSPKWRPPGPVASCAGSPAGSRSRLTWVWPSA